MCDSSGDDFAKAYADVRDFLTGRLDADDKEMKRLSAALSGLDAEGTAALTDKINTIKARFETLKAKLADASGAIELDTNLPSLLVSVNGGTVKASKVSPGGIEGEADGCTGRRRDGSSGPMVIGDADDA